MDRPGEHRRDGERSGRGTASENSSGQPRRTDAARRRRSRDTPPRALGAAHDQAANRHQATGHRRARAGARAAPTLHRRGSGATPGGQGTRDVGGLVARISPAQPEEAARRKAWSRGEPAVDRTTMEESVRETARGQNASDARPPRRGWRRPLMRRRWTRTPAAKDLGRMTSRTDLRHCEKGATFVTVRSGENSGGTPLMAAAPAGCPGGTIKSRPDAASGGALWAALTGSHLQDGALLCEVGGGMPPTSQPISRTPRNGRRGAGGPLGVTGPLPRREGEVRGDVGPAVGGDVVGGTSPKTPACSGRSAW